MINDGNCAGARLHLPGGIVTRWSEYHLHEKRKELFTNKKGRLKKHKREYGYKSVYSSNM